MGFKSIVRSIRKVAKKAVNEVKKGVVDEPRKFVENTMNDYNKAVNNVDAKVTKQVPGLHGVVSNLLGANGHAPGVIGVAMDIHNGIGTQQKSLPATSPTYQPQRRPLP